MKSPPPRRPQTSISVFPRELPPGTRGQSVASCRPRNVTSPPTHTPLLLTRSPVVASLLLNPALLTLHLHQLPRRERRRDEAVWACVRISALCVHECVCLWKFCVHDEECKVSASCSWGSLVVGKPWGLPHTASGHGEEGDYLIAASHSAQIKTKVTQTNTRWDCKSKHELACFCAFSLTCTGGWMCSTYTKVSLICGNISGVLSY